MDMLDSATANLDPGPLKDIMTTLLERISCLAPEFPDAASQSTLFHETEN
jgi:hypothetical protein